MIDLLLQVLLEIWEILKEASVFLLFGFLLAGTLAVLVPKGLFTRLLGTGKAKSVLWASVIGIPLPLCSCGVVPTALGLRRQGATSGATVAFLIATPETGVDFDQPDLCPHRPDPDHCPTARRHPHGHFRRLRDQLFRRRSRKGGTRPSPFASTTSRSANWR